MSFRDNLFNHGCATDGCGESLLTPALRLQAEGITQVALSLRNAMAGENPRIGQPSPTSETGGENPAALNFHDAVDSPSPSPSNFGGEQVKYPTLDAWATRGAYLGLTGQLAPSMEAITQRMATMGPVGQAAVQRMAVLEGQGWKFGAMGWADPYARDAFPGLKGLVARTFALTGYNDDIRKAIRHNSFANSLNAIFGLSANPVSHIATAYTHELGHGQFKDTYNRFESTPQRREQFAKLFNSATAAGDAARAHSPLMLKEEINALSAQAAATETRSLRTTLFPQQKGLMNVVVQQHFKDGTIGDYVQKNWRYAGLQSQYLSPQQAHTLGIAYDAEINRGGLYQGGRFNQAAREANALRISQLAAADIAAAEASTRLSALSAVAAQDTSAMARFFQNPRNRQFLSRGGQALGALGLFATLTDVKGAFGQSTGTGVGRLADVGANFAGFEVGMAGGTHIGRFATTLISKRFPMAGTLVIPLSGFIGGIIGAQVSHETIGRDLQKSIAEAIDSPPQNK